MVLLDWFGSEPLSLSLPLVCLTHLVQSLSALGVPHLISHIPVITGVEEEEEGE